MALLLHPENVTLRELCSSLAFDTATTSDTQPEVTQPPPSLSTPGTDSNENKAVVVVPYVLITATIIVVLIIDFTLYHRNNAYKYRRKMERTGHDINRQFRKVRGAARVPMDPEHLMMFGAREASACAAESSSSSAHDQGHVYTDDDIGGLSAAVTAQNSKAQHVARRAKISNTINDAEKGMAAWQLKFGKQRSLDNTPKRFMNVLSPKKV